MSAPGDDLFFDPRGGVGAPPHDEVRPPAARFAAVSRVLRAAGSAALVAALSTFLWQHWQEGSDLMRAGALLLHTIGLALAGLVCGLGARDGKAARTFLGLASASLPIVGCVAGGLVYSQLAWDPAPTGVAGYATWVAPSAAAALGAAVLALATALPVAALTLGVFARPRAGLLTAALVGGIALLMLPTRDTDAIALLVAAALAGLGVLEWRVLRHEPALATLEGALARVLVAAPPLVMLARAALHYDLTPLFHALVWLSVAMGLTGLSWLRALHPVVRDWLRWVALVPAALASLAGAESLVALGVPGGLGVPLAAGAFAAQLVAASLAAGDANWGVEFRRLAGFGFTAACVGNLLLEPGVMGSLVAGVASIALLAWGTLRESRALQLAGAAGALAAVSVHVHHAIALYHWNRWGSLALLGAAVILAASAVERFGPRALVRLEVWRRRLASFE